MGLSYQKTAAAAGITHRTLSYYIKKRQKSRFGKYLNFFNQLQKAEVEGEQKNLKKNFGAAAGGQEFKRTKEIFNKNKIVKEISTNQKSAPDCRATAWILERMYPEWYGKHRIKDNSYPPAYGKYDIFILVKTLSNMPKVEIERLELIFLTTIYNYL